MIECGLRANAEFIYHQSRIPLFDIQCRIRRQRVKQPDIHKSNDQACLFLTSKR